MARTSASLRIDATRWLLLLAMAAPLGPGVSTARAQGEAYYFATAGLPVGASSFRDIWCGPDMLPYTEDDLELPERGNVGGTWGFSWIDSDGDGVVGGEERIFVVIRRGDDDMFTFSTRSYPQYGVIAEAEDWIDYHEARHRGPSSTMIGDPNAEGSDFEHNDRSGGGEPGWESASNYYWYNNAVADQRGWGGSRYYFEHQNGTGLDEIEGFNKWLTFQCNMDDPTTPGLNESGPCKNSWMRSTDAIQKGLLIPIDEIPDLETGSLDPLFGWYSGDMADYVRDVLGPRLEDESLEVFSSGAGCAQSGLPPTHVMLLQIECPISINASGDCGSTTDAEAQAAYWGVEPIVPGSPETDAVYRASHVLLFSDTFTAVEIGVPEFVTAPDDDVERTLWVQDDFWRDDVSRIGRYAVAGGWSIEPDFSMDRGCGELDMYLQLSGGEPGHFEAPLPSPLELEKGDVLVVADVAYFENAASTAPVFQLILLDDEGVVAWADFGPDASSVNVGGSLDGDGLATDPESTDTGAPGEMPILDVATSEFARFVLRVGPAKIELLRAEPDEYTPNRYEYLDEYEVLEEHRTPISTSGITAVRLATRGGPDLRPVVDGFAVFSNVTPSEPEGDFLRGDTNNDGKVDISDGIFLLNHLFLGGERWVCDPAANANDDGSTDLSDAVYVFNHLFLGGPALPAPFPECGPSPHGEICPESDCNG